MRIFQLDAKLLCEVSDHSGEEVAAAGRGEEEAPDREVVSSFGINPCRQGKVPIDTHSAAAIYCCCCR